MNHNRRDFIKKSSALGVSSLLSFNKNIFKMDTKVRTAHIGVGGMGLNDLKAISSHKNVVVSALCDVDSNLLNKAHKLFPKAKIFKDYRVLLNKLESEIDAVVISTPDHSHGPASIMAMEKGKAIYCQKPLTNNVIDAREMSKISSQKKLVTQMGIQVHSFYDYKLAKLLIQEDTVGKIHTVRAWSPKNWGFDGDLSKKEDEIPDNLNWNLWLGTSPYKNYQENQYHQYNWRKMIGFGCGTLGDMGVHIFDTPYNSLELDVPESVINKCRKPNEIGFPEKNKVSYVFPGTKFTTEKLKWIWEDGKGAPSYNKDLKLPNGDKLPQQGAMFIGEKGKLLLPHFMELPKIIIDNKYEAVDASKFEENGLLEKNPARNYEKESLLHYHEFIDACLNNKKCTAPFSYSSKLTETILLGVIAGRFPGEKLNWDKDKGLFKEKKANQFLKQNYRSF
jgi:predicted dehydrogenase